VLSLIRVVPTTSWSIAAVVLSTDAGWVEEVPDAPVAGGGTGTLEEAMVTEGLRACFVASPLAPPPEGP
jgi:hypothetical protein